MVHLHGSARCFVYPLRSLPRLSLFVYLRRYDPLCRIIEGMMNQLFDMASSQPLLKQTNDSNNSFLTIHYNPYKPNLMAASCSNHTIQLFNTNSHTLSNFFSTLPPSHDHPLPTAIETEFEVRDISWNPQNPCIPSSSLRHRSPRGMWHRGRKWHLRVGRSFSVLLIRFHH